MKRELIVTVAFLAGFALGTNSVFFSRTRTRPLPPPAGKVALTYDLKLQSLRSPTVSGVWLSTTVPGQPLYKRLYLSMVHEGRGAWYVGIMLPWSIHYPACSLALGWDATFKQPIIQVFKD